jgi:hypothetical protein
MFISSTQRQARKRAEPSFTSCLLAIYFLNSLGEGVSGGILFGSRGLKRWLDVALHTDLHARLVVTHPLVTWVFLHIPIDAVENVFKLLLGVCQPGAHVCVQYGHVLLPLLV